jgi:hypothetical protein
VLVVLLVAWLLRPNARLRHRLRLLDEIPREWPERAELEEATRFEVQDLARRPPFRVRAWAWAVVTIWTVLLVAFYADDLKRGTRSGRLLFAVLFASLPAYGGAVVARWFSRPILRRRDRRRARIKMRALRVRAARSRAGWRYRALARFYARTLKH